MENTWKRYAVEIRKKVKNWEVPDIWDIVNYPEEYILAENPKDAIYSVKDFVNEDDANYSDFYEWRAIPYDENGDLDYQNIFYM